MVEAIHTEGSQALGAMLADTGVGCKIGPGSFLDTLQVETHHKGVLFTLPGNLPGRLYPLGMEISQDDSGKVRLSFWPRLSALDLHQHPREGDFHPVVVEGITGIRVPGHSTKMIVEAISQYPIGHTRAVVDLRSGEVKEQVKIHLV